MATRFRFPSAGNAFVSPALQSYSHTPTTRRFRLLTDDGSALATASESPDGSDHLAAGDTFFAQFVSDPLAAQTFTSGDAFKLAMQCSETNNGNNLFLQIWMGVYTGDGSSLQATIRSKVSDDTEFTTSLLNKIFNGTLSSSYTCAAGERLVIEISAAGTPTAAGGVQGHNAGIRFGSDGSSGDLPENNTEAGTTFNPWVEFANTITFLDLLATAGERPEGYLRPDTHVPY